jgi:predicted PurR-regulated permease PerM
MVKISGPNRGRVLTIAYAATLVTRQYLLGLAKMIFCLWIMYGLGFTLLGVENALFFAVLCGLLEIIPFIGNLVGTSLTVLFAAIHGAGIPVLAGIVIIYGVVQFIQGWILEPLIVGRQVKINPLFTIIALVAGELIWGIPGIFLALPVTAICKVVCDHIESLHPYGFLIGNVKPGRKGLKIIRKVNRLYRSSH